MVDIVGFKPVALHGYIVTTVSLILSYISSSLSFALFACILMGVGAMSLNTVNNTLIPIVLFEGKDPVRASNFGNGFFALGYILTPLLVVFMLNTLNMSFGVGLEHCHFPVKNTASI